MITAAKKAECCSTLEQWNRLIRSGPGACWVLQYVSQLKWIKQHPLLLLQGTSDRIRPSAPWLPTHTS